ncbi:hypothetical protein KX928_00950 [Roseobacter sp. YSTF-M11]|uniref:Uncharacterized protein n=1 Tax=Roseobacter insulae TaxID=2859783 RepID=A0A9X1K0C8_9RHOB|nr:hypothetical protein [Roseobacter insulae]MBW4706348.1 hypothetical protein [Roseobacter insulae]
MPYTMTAKFHSSRQAIRLATSLFGLSVLTAIAAPAAAQSAAPVLKSAGAIEFSDDVLFVGDSAGNQVVAFQLGAETLTDQANYQLGRPQTFEGRTIVEDLPADIGRLTGAPADQITINDVAVHAATQQIVVSAHRGLGPDAVPVLARINDGAVELIDHAGLSATVHALGAPPAQAALEFGQPAAFYTITDIDHYNGELFVSGVSGEDFDSTLRRIAYPFTGEQSETQIEIWHAVHAQWETRAPIISQTIAEVDGVPTLVAVYACTPLVRIPLSDLTDGAQIRGEMIGELGYGNTPIDIFAYNNPMDGSDNVLVTNTNRSANAIPLQLIADAEPMAVDVPNNFGPAGLTGFPVPLSGVQHIDLINDNWAVAVRPDPKDPTRIQVQSLLVPFFFNRADHMVEMNWPGTADPFGYRQFPPLDL